VPVAITLPTPSAEATSSRPIWRGGNVPLSPVGVFKPELQHPMPFRPLFVNEGFWATAGPAEGPSPTKTTFAGEEDPSSWVSAIVDDP
jgi:hypothetical protein